MPFLAYSVNNAADNAFVAAYVAAILYWDIVNSYIFRSFHAAGVRVATWVPFFDNGKCIGQVMLHVDFVLHFF